MTNDEFNKIAQARLDEIVNRMIRKGKEYASGEDRLSNIRTTAFLCKNTMPEVCFNFMSKHIISIRDMVQDRKSYPMDVWIEKLGDIIVYCILLEAAVFEVKTKKRTPNESSN